MRAPAAPPVPLVPRAPPAPAARRLPGGAVLLLALLLLPVLLAGGTPASAQAAPGAREIAVLVHEAAPGERAPQTRVDNVMLLGPAESTGSAFSRMQSALTARTRTGTPLAVELEARPGPNDTLEVEASWRATGLPLPAQVAYRLVLVTDDGHDRRLRVHEELSPVIEAAQDEEGTVRAVARIPRPALDPGLRFGVVALAQNDGPGDARHQAGEVLQSATWLTSQSGPTHQEAKAVLFEHWTRADACATCSDVDAALLLLASQRGFPADADALGAASYAVAPGWRAYVGLAAGLAVGVALVVRRRGA